MKISSRIIQDLINEIVGDIGALYKASEAVRDPDPSSRNASYSPIRSLL